MRSWLILIFAAFTAFSFPPKKTKVWLIGDSTMSIKDKRAYPEHGWGMPFAGFFDSTIEVDNRAKNGRSTKTFIKEGLWQPVADNLSEGDYVFIQFGHNDEVKTKASYSTEEEFTANLDRYIAETRAKKALPVLLTPVSGIFVMPAVDCASTFVKNKMVGSNTRLFLIIIFSLVADKYDWPGPILDS